MARKFEKLVGALGDRRQDLVGLIVLSGPEVDWGSAVLPLQANMLDERLDFKELFGNPNYFALRVQGQSMIENHIEDGDYVVVRKQETAHNGERVVARIEDEVTLKRYFREKNRIRLEPANQSMAPIFVDEDDDIQILGILVGVVRKC